MLDGVQSEVMSLQRVPLNNFRGGLNTRDGAFDLQPNESPDLLNVTISSLVGQLETRKGKTRLDIAGMPASETDFAKQVVVGNGKRFLMLSINGGIYALKPNGEVIKLFAGTAGTIWDFELYSDAAFKDWVYCGNGVDVMQKWDGEAVATVEWKATKGTVPKGGVLCVWENRMFISYVTANVQRVYFSEFGDPEATITEYGFVDVRGSEDDLDAVQDLAVLGARLIILKRRDIFFISSSTTMLNRRIGGPGVWSRFQVAELEDKLYFFNPQGIWSTGGVQVTMESGSINNYFPTNVNQAHLDKARVITTKDTYPRLLVAVPTGTSVVNNTLIEMVPHINFRRIGGRRYLLLPAFMLHTIPASALACWNPAAQVETIVGATLLGAVKEFPVLEITDSFARAKEVHLSNGGKWSAIFNFQLSGATGEVVNEMWQNAVGAFGEGGAIWTSGGEVNKPATEIEVAKMLNATTATLLGVTLYSCFTKVSEEMNGYDIRFFWNPGLQKWTLRFYKWVKNVLTKLSETNITALTIPINAENTRFGTTVSEGVLKAWMNVAGKGWVLVGTLADGTFTKGFSGFEITCPEGKRQNKSTARNFRVGALSEPFGRLSTLFLGATDEGTEIVSHWQSSWMAIQGEEPYERIRRLNVELSGDAVVEVFSDFSELPLFSQTIPKSGGEGSEYRFARVRPEARGRFHSVKFRTLPGGAPFLINAAELAVRGGKEHT